MRQNHSNTQCCDSGQQDSGFSIIASVCILTHLYSITKSLNHSSLDFLNTCIHEFILFSVIEPDVFLDLVLCEGY